MSTVKLAQNQANLSLFAKDLRNKLYLIETPTLLYALNFSSRNMNEVSQNAPGAVASQLFTRVYTSRTTSSSTKLPLFRETDVISDCTGFPLVCYVITHRPRKNRHVALLILTAPETGRRRRET